VLTAWRFFQGVSQSRKCADHRSVSAESILRVPSRLRRRRRMTGWPKEGRTCGSPWLPTALSILALWSELSSRTSAFW
jgi:hypothetical protein